MNRIAVILALAAGIACAAFGYEPPRHNDTFTTNGVTYAQRGGLGASDYVVTNIDASAVGNVKSVNGKTGDVELTAYDADGFTEWRPYPNEEEAGYEVVSCVWTNGAWQVKVREFATGSVLSGTDASPKDALILTVFGDLNSLFRERKPVQEILESTLVNKADKSGVQIGSMFIGFTDEGVYVRDLATGEGLLLSDGKMARKTAAGDTFYYEYPSGSGTFAFASDIPNVPAWALESHKPSYTASEVGAIPTTGGVFNASLHLNHKLSVGTWTSSVSPYDISGGSGIAFVFGDNVHTKRSNTMTLGVGALNTNEWSFVWNGDPNRMYFPTIPSMSNPYPSRYNGGFHVNPSVREGMTNPLQNFWIGDTNLATWVATLALGKTGDQTLQSGILTINRDAPDGDAWLQTKRGEQYGVAVAFGGFRNGEYFQSLPYANGVVALLSDIYAAIEQIAPAFTRKAYALDELCTYNGVVYRCKMAYTAEIYNPKPDADTTRWEAKRVSELFARLSDLQNYLPLDYFKDGQTIPMYWGDGTKLCDFGANWLGNLENAVSEKPDYDDIPPAVSNVVTKAYVENLGITSEETDPTVPQWAKAPTKPAYTASEVGATSPTAVSNIVTTAYVREKLGIYLYVGEDGGIYVHTNEE